MDWLHSPRFVRVRDAVLADLRRKEYHFRKVGAVVFLCGKRQSPARDRLKEYLLAARKDCLVFYAEAAWDIIAGQTSAANLLQVEDKLANLADIVIIVVESPGTFAELGAFAMSPPLRKKLLPLLDVGFQGSSSFIFSGPIKLIDRESEFAPSIWVRHERILECAGELDKRLEHIPGERARRISDLSKSEKHQLFFVCELVTVFGPCPASHITFFASQLISTPIDIPLMLGLATALNLVREFRQDDQDFFFRPLQDGNLTSFQYQKQYVDVSQLRARVLGAMQRCPEGCVALELLAKHAAAS